MKHDTDYTRNITCPHCGYEDHDSWEHNGDGDGQGIDCDCKKCGDKICGEVHVTVTYSTWKPDPPNSPIGPNSDVGRLDGKDGK